MTNPENPQNPDEELRRALHDAVADVRPEGTLDDIRSRTDKAARMNRRWMLPTLAAAAVMAVVVSGAFWLVNDDDATRNPSGTPTTGTSASTAPSESPDDESPDNTPSQTADPRDEVAIRAVPVYYAGETAHGMKLFREFHRMEVMTKLPSYAGLAAARAAVQNQPADPDYTNPWPDGVRVSEAEFGGDVMTIGLTGDVHDLPAGMSRAEAELAIQQLIYSAQAGYGKGRVPVQLLIDGKHTDTVLGVPASEPLAAANADDVLAPVQIDTPAEGATVGSTFQVSGRAAAFEANVVWELKQGDTVVKHGYSTAQECCRLAPYAFEVTAPAGQYTLVVHDEDMSGEGRAVNEDTKQITVR